MARKRPRPQVSTQIRGPGFRPSASPVDTFAQQNEGSGLRQLAQALSQVAPELTRFAIQLDQEQDEESLRAADRAAGEDLMATKEEFEKARKERMIENHQDPIFRARYQELVGRHAAEEVSQNFSEWRDMNMPDATTLEEFDEGFDVYMDERLEDTVGDAIQNPAYRSAFQDTLRQRLLQERARFRAQAGAKLSNLSDEEYRQEATASFVNDARNGLSADVIAGRAAERLNAHLDFKAGGEDHPEAMARKYNEETFEAMAGQVQTLAAQGDIDSAERLMSAMSAMKVGTGLLRHTSYGEGIYLETLARLEQADNLASSREDRLNQDFITDTITETRGSIREEGLRVEDIQPQLDALEALGTSAGYQAADSLRTYTTSWEQASGVTAPRLLDTLTPRMFDNEWSLDRKVRALDGHIASGDLNQRDYVQLRQIAMQVASAGSSGGPLTDEAYKQARDLFEDQFTSGLLGSMSNEDAEQLRRALPQFTAQWLAWRSQNPDASFAEQAAELEVMGDSLLQRYAPSLSIDFGFTPPPPARWNLKRIITDDHWGAVNEYISTGGSLEGPEARQNFREAMQLSGINFRAPTTQEEQQQIMEQLSNLREAQAPFMEDAIPQNPTPRPGPTPEPTVTPEGAQAAPGGEEGSAQAEPGEEDRLAPIREELESQDDAALVSELGDSIARFRELREELGVFGGLNFRDVGKPSFSIEFDEEGLEERARLRDRVAVIQGILQDRDVDISDINTTSQLASSNDNQE